jgi:hypothetical protein
MTVRLSTGARNGMAARMGFAAMLNQGYIEVYSGSQPATADAAKTGTLLGRFTSASATLTKETRATGTIQVTAAASGSINSVSVGGLNIIPDGAVAAVAGDTAATALALCTAINRNGMFEASLSGSTVTIKGRPGSGAIVPVITNSLTTVTTTLGTPMSGGITPANGLILGVEASGVIAKPATQIWSFVGEAAGTAGWARFYSSDSADGGGILSGAPWYPRMDGTCGVGSGDFQMSTLAITVGLPVTLDSFTWTQPAS